VQHFCSEMNGLCCVLPFFVQLHNINQVIQNIQFDTCLSANSIACWPKRLKINQLAVLSM
jgi:hypothetical protein